MSDPSPDDGFWSRMVFAILSASAMPLLASLAILTILLIRVLKIHTANNQVAAIAAQYNTSTAMFTLIGPWRLETMKTMRLTGERIIRIAAARATSVPKWCPNDPSRFSSMSPKPGSRFDASNLGC